MATAAVSHPVVCPPRTVTPETWKLCPLNPDYLVSCQGRVRRIGGGILKPQPTTRGYVKVHLGSRLQRSVHVVVAATFHGPRPAGHHVDHVNHDKLDNRAVNLRYLPALVNSVRWAGRDSSGANLWETPDSPAPEEHVPLTAQELAEVEATAAAWGELDALEALRTAGLTA